jgi:hypothetical protein
VRRWVAWSSIVVSCSKASGWRPRGDLAPGFCVPVIAQLRVTSGEIGGQRRIDDDVEVVPGNAGGGGTMAVAVDDLFEFVQQFLGAADAEGRDEHRAALVAEGVFADRLQPLPAIRRLLVAAVAVGALQHDDVGGIRRLGRRQQGRVGRAEVAGEDDALPVRSLRQFAFDVGRAEDVAGRGELDAQAGVAGDDAVPRFVGQGDELAADLRQEAFDQHLVAGETDLEGVFEDQRQQGGGSLAADDRPAVSGGQQVGDAADMVDMDMTDDQRAHPIDRKGDGQPISACAFPGGFSPLEEAAVHQQGLSIGQAELVARPGHTINRAMVGNREGGSHFFGG